MSKKITVTIPTDWEHITLGQFQRYLEASKGGELDAITGTVAALTTLSIPEARTIPLTDLYAVYGRLMNAMPDGKRYPLLQRIKLDGTDFGFHPDLIGMSLGEFIDLSSLDKGFWPDAHKTLAILYRPLTGKGKGAAAIEPYRADHLDNAPLFQALPMSTVLGATAFFLSFLMELPATLLTYSERLTGRAYQQAVAAGMRLSTTSPTLN